MLQGGIGSALNVFLLLAGHVTSGFGPDGNLILEGDDTADHVHLRVDSYGHLIVRGLRGTRIDGATVKDFGLVTDLGEESRFPSRGHLVVHGKGGQDQLWFDSTVQAFEGNVFLDGGGDTDLIQVQGDIHGSVIASGNASDHATFHGIDNLIDDSSGDVIRFHQVVVSGLLGVAGSVGDDYIQITNSIAELLIVVATGDGISFDSTGGFAEPIVRVASRGDIVTIDRTQAILEVIVIAKTYPIDIDQRFHNSVRLTHITAGGGVHVRGAWMAAVVDDVHVVTGPCHIAGDHGAFQVTNVSAKPSIQLISDKVVVRKARTDGILFVGQYAESHPFFSKSNVQISDVVAGTDIAVNGETVDVRHAQAGRDLLLEFIDPDDVHVPIELAGGKVRFSHVTVGRNIEGISDSMAIDHTQVGQDLILTTYNSVSLESVVIRGLTNIFLNADNLKGKLAVRDSRFVGLFTADLTDGKDAVDVWNNKFLKVGSYIDAHDGIDALFSRLNTPSTNMQFRNFEVKK